MTAIADSLNSRRSVQTAYSGANDVAVTGRPTALFMAGDGERTGALRSTDDAAGRLGLTSDRRTSSGGALHIFRKPLNYVWGRSESRTIQPVCISWHS